MEFEVKASKGIEDCYVSLPLSLIQSLQPRGIFPQSLALELRSILNPNHVWFVAWSGSASASAAIEVAQQFAECISLPDRSKVNVRVASNLPVATLVSIEPLTEDDWEVLELNAEHAENAILSQGAAVQLAAGTEVAVAPKRRKKTGETINTPGTSSPHVRALLRLQDPDAKMIHKSEVRGIEVGAVLTTIAIIHPETAKTHSIEALQLVSLQPKLTLVDTSKGHVNDKKNSSDIKDVENGVDAAKRIPHQAVVRVLTSELVTKGHVMIAHSLRLYLQARRHSWIFMNSCDLNLKREAPSFLLSPYKFNMLKNDNHVRKNTVEHSDSMATKTSLDIVERSAKELIDLYFDGFCNTEHEKSDLQSASNDGIQSLFRVWFTAQLEGIGLNTKVDVSSLILGRETLVHIKMRDGHFFTNLENGHGQSLSKGLLADNIGVDVPYVDILYVLFVETAESDGSLDVCDIYRNNEKKIKDIDDLDSLFRNLRSGAPVIIRADEERTSKKHFCLTPSSLDWVAPAADDVINRLMMLLSPISVTWWSFHNLPLPGHVLVYGPPGSGKTLLTRAVAKSLEEDKSLLTHIVVVHCSEHALEKTSNIRQSLSRHISEALDHSPSLIILDDLDSLVSSTSDLDGIQPSTSTSTLSEFLADILDEYEETRKKSCGVGPIAFLATSQSLESIPLPLRCSATCPSHLRPRSNT